MFSSYFVIEISRLLSFRNVHSMVPLYLSFIPYSIFHMLAREAHMLFGALWFVSLMAINLQIGTPKLRIHVFIASIVFLSKDLLVPQDVRFRLTVLLLRLSPKVIYFILTLIMDRVIVRGAYGSAFELATNVTYRYDANCDINSTYITFTPDANDMLCSEVAVLAVTWQAELTFVLSIMLLSFQIFQLQRFIQEYAYNLIDRQNHVARLSKQNADLKTQLKAMKKDIDLDLDSPITKVIKSIRNIQEQCDLDVDVMESLDYVIQLLSSNQLFMPNLNVNNKDSNDSDVKNWINAMITNKTDVAAQERVPGSVAANAVMFKQVTSANDVQIKELLKTIDTWEFSMFDLVDLTNGRPLYYLGMEVFEQQGLKDLFDLDENVIRAFLVTMEAGYKPNLYHNSTHAADVLQAIHYFLQTLNLRALVKPEDIFAAVVAATIHDLDHPGTNNAFMINSSSPLAIRYNDQSVLENHHCAKAFEIMMSPDSNCNILSTLSPEKFKQVRSCILSMVLATDMAGHFEFIAKFKNKLSGQSKAHFRISLFYYEEANVGSFVCLVALNVEDPKDRQLMLDIAIKCGDISNSTKSAEIMKKWAELIMEEFFRQGDEEMKNKIPVSMFMDRHNTVIPKCQVGFIDYIVNPLYEVWDAFVNEEHNFPALQNLSKNREYWKKTQTIV
ncbi:High affinity cAMP-specific 3',5'-cyclic phosphodiesterase 7A [Irineochytrium annulatum]|nr:High affinity cAMP-specific 3',5'-cyclic phosphodiesterase 7A [Irineochytrium annulatum]